MISPSDSVMAREPRRAISRSWVTRSTVRPCSTNAANRFHHTAAAVVEFQACRWFVGYHDGGIVSLMARAIDTPLLLPTG